MEYVLGGSSFWLLHEEGQGVLILIVMEYVLGEDYAIIMRNFDNGLNPYCNGICSRS